MDTYGTLKKVASYFQVKDFLIENAHLVSDTAFKVILNLFSRVDFNLSNCYAPMSFSEIRQRTAKTNQSIQRAINELEAKGLVIKISGKHQPQTAFASRVVAYNNLQKPVRSYNEVNVYDLTGLVILAGIYYKLCEFFDVKEVREFFHQVRKYQELTGKPYLSILSGVIPDENKQGGMPIGIGVCLLGKSDIPIRHRDMPIGISDMPIGKEPIPENQNHKPHTHTTRTDGNEEKGDKRSLENQRLEGNPYQNTGSDTAKVYGGGGDKLELPRELKEFILDKLKEQEEQGKIKNAIAVFKKLTEQDIDYYKQIYEEGKKRVIVLDSEAIKSLKLEGAVKKAKEKGRLHIANGKYYILTIQEKAEKLSQVAQKKGIEVEIRDYGPEWRKYFSP